MLSVWSWAQIWVSEGILRVTKVQHFHQLQAADNPTPTTHPQRLFIRLLNIDLRTEL